MTKVEIRETEVEYGETGVGVSNRVETVYELGGEIDGVFVPFVTVPAGKVDDFRARAEAEAGAKEKKKKGDEADSEAE